MKETSNGSKRSSKPSAVRPLLLGLLILAVVAAIIVPLYILVMATWIIRSKNVAVETEKEPLSLLANIGWSV